MPSVVRASGIFIIRDHKWRQFHCNSPSNKGKKIPIQVAHWQESKDMFFPRIKVYVGVEYEFIYVCIETHTYVYTGIRIARQLVNLRLRKADDY